MRIDRDFVDRRGDRLLRTDPVRLVVPLLQQVDQGIAIDEALQANRIGQRRLRILRQGAALLLIGKPGGRQGQRNRQHTPPNT